MCAFNIIGSCLPVWILDEVRGKLESEETCSIIKFELWDGKDKVNNVYPGEEEITVVFGDHEAIPIREVVSGDGRIEIVVATDEYELSL